MRFTWDPDKNLASIRRHAIAFADAARIFEDPTAERVDGSLRLRRIRVYAVGLVNGVEITVIYTNRDDDKRHMICAWRAEPHERRHYWRNLES